MNVFQNTNKPRRCSLDRRGLKHLSEETLEQFAG